VNRPEATIEELLALVPELDELEVLRLRLVATAVRDPGKQWDSSNAYTTIDKRIVSPGAAERAVAEAEQAMHEHVSLLHRGLLPFFTSFFADDRDAAARHLITLGEELESTGRAMAARRCYRAALTVSLPLPEKSPQILALRRIGRVSLNVGDFQEAAAYYERSAELAHDSGDLHAEVVARTGLGNVLTWQGQWGKAEKCYHDALALADGTDPGSLTLERGQIYNNLANLTTRMQRLDEAEGWFESAFRVWERLTSPVDLAICNHNHAHLREAQERWEDAQRSYEASLKQPVSSTVHAIVATDYAEWWLHEGYLTQAEEWGQVAEEHAIASGSPYTLGHMYRGRGNLARASGAVDGFTFYEKALEIARSKGYPLLEAETLLDYASLRAQNGGGEEAIAYLERASELFRELGAVSELARAQATLNELRIAEPTPAPAPDLALAGDAPLAAAVD
jgi:tetratricopeptide (TPR) repeat protein